jgi:ribosomal protein L1
MRGRGAPRLRRLLRSDARHGWQSIDHPVVLALEARQQRRIATIAIGAKARTLAVQGGDKSGHGSAGELLSAAE